MDEDRREGCEEVPWELIPVLREWFQEESCAERGKYKVQGMTVSARKLTRSSYFERYRQEDNILCIPIVIIFTPKMGVFLSLLNSCTTKQTILLLNLSSFTSIQNFLTQCFQNWRYPHFTAFLLYYLRNLKLIKAYFNLDYITYFLKNQVS